MAKLNIERVIDESTSEVSLSDLSKKGFKQVKVLSHSHIAKLIEEAVDRTISERASAISAAEREKVIAESRKEFENLARDSLQTKSAVEQLESEKQQLIDELERARKRLKESLTLEAEVQTLRAQAAQGGASSQQVIELQQQLLESEKSAAKLQGQLEAKKEEILRLVEAGSTMRSQVMETLENMKAGGGGGMNEDIKASLDGILSRISKGGLAAPAEATDPDTIETRLKFADRDADVSLESNISEVKVQHKKASGVKNTLAKLKEMRNRSEG